MIKHFVLVASGKGGVGKSTVATNVALALAKLGHRVGLLDADIYGPSIPTMLGDVGKPDTPDGKKIYAPEKFGLKLMSMGYLVQPDQAMIWRGPMLANAVTQLVNDVEWGDLDYLLFDLPPGTGDIQLTLAQKFSVTGAVLVTTPQDVALADVVRAKAMFDRVRIPTIGVIENMSYFVCDQCDTKHPLFGAGGGRKIAQDLGLTLLGEVPLEATVREGGDAGVPVLESHPEGVCAGAFKHVADQLVVAVDRLAAEQASADEATAAAGGGGAARRGLPIITQ